MVDETGTAGARAADGRLAAALARLLRRLAGLLARSDHDETSRRATDRGLAWAAEFARSVEARECSRWLEALRASGARTGTRSPGTWPALGAPHCLALARSLEDLGLDGAIGDAAVDWKRRQEELAQFAEPARTAEPLATAERAPRTDSVRPAPHACDVAEILRAAGIGARVADGFSVGLDPSDLRSLVEALAPWIVPLGLHVTRPGGRIELSGRTSPDAGLPEALRAIARAIGSSAGIDAGTWWVRLPLAEAPHYLFAEVKGRKVAIPWHRVVAYGLAEGADRPRVLLGAGFERVDLALDWLHGKGEGRPQHAASGPVILNAEGQAYEEIDPAAFAPLQNPSLPADNPTRGEAPGPGPIALVADDSLTARVFLARLLGQRGIAVDEAEDLPTAQVRLGARPYDIAFLDADMPGGGALAIPRTADADWLDRAVVLVKDEDERRQAEALGFAHVLYKPFAEDEVTAVVQALTRRVRPGVH